MVVQSEEARLSYAFRFEVLSSDFPFRPNKHSQGRWISSRFVSEGQSTDLSTDWFRKPLYRSNRGYGIRYGSN